MNRDPTSDAVKMGAWGSHIMHEEFTRDEPETHTF